LARTLGTSTGFEPTTGETLDNSSDPLKPEQDPWAGVEVESELMVCRRL
jgi:hypothetical protein